MKTGAKWKLHELGDYSDYDGQCQVITAGDRRIAIVLVSDDETKTNARLIAAAPELLAACEAVMKDDSDEHYRDLCSIAIAKAKGEQG